MNLGLSPEVLQRLFALAGLALLVTIVALAVTRSTRSDSIGLPESAPAPGGGWYEALAAPEPVASALHAGACGFRVTKTTVGVAHPALPCGAQIYIEFENREVLTRVIGRGPSSPRSEFAVTKALADKIDLQGVQRVKWRFASAG